MATTPLTIRELATDAEIAAAHAVMVQLRPHLPCGDGFVARVRQQREQHGYVLFGGFVGDALVSLAGVRPQRTLSRGHHLFVDDLVTVAEARGDGHGRAMLRAVARYAASNDLPLICLDSRDTARTFYERVGFTLRPAVPCLIATADLLAQDHA